MIKETEYLIPVENDKNIFIYWEGPEYPLIVLLRKIIYKFSKGGSNFKVFFLNDSNINKYIEVPKEYHRLAVNHKSDLIRANIVYKYGGIWLDSDTLVMSDLKSLFDIVDKKDGFLIRENNSIVCTGVFGSKSKTKFLNEWVKRINTKVKKRNLGWSDIGPEMVDAIHKSTDTTENFTIFNGLDTVYPVNWDMCVRYFLEIEKSQHHLLERDYQPLIILVNSVYKKLKNKTEEEILTMDNPLAYFLKKSLDLGDENE